jgi:hypothetical protein
VVELQRESALSAIHGLPAVATARTPFSLRPWVFGPEGAAGCSHGCSAAKPVEAGRLRFCPGRGSGIASDHVPDTPLAERSQPCATELTGLGRDFKQRVDRRRLSSHLVPDAALKIAQPFECQLHRLVFVTCNSAKLVGCHFLS